MTRILSLFYSCKESKKISLKKIEINNQYLKNLQNTKNDHDVELNEMKNRRKILASKEYKMPKVKFFGQKARHNPVSQILFLLIIGYLSVQFVGKTLLLLLYIVSADSSGLSNNITSYITVIISLIVIVTAFWGKEIVKVKNNKKKIAEIKVEKRQEISNIDNDIQKIEIKKSEIESLLSKMEKSVIKDNTFLNNFLMENIKPSLIQLETMIESNPLNIVSKRIYDIAYLKELREIFQTEQAKDMGNALALLESRTQLSENIGDLKKSFETFSKSIILAIGAVHEAIVNQNNLLQDMNSKMSSLHDEVSKSNVFLSTMTVNQKNMVKMQNDMAKNQKETIDELKKITEHHNL